MGEDGVYAISISSITTENGKMDSNENLAKGSNFEIARKKARLWKLIAIVASFGVVVLAALLIWQIATRPAASQKASCKTSGTNNISSSSTPPCPRMPNIHPLPNPLPVELEKVFKEIETMLATIVDEETSLPGISANVFYRDTILWSGHFGSKLFKVFNSTPGDNTVYRIGSITKIFPVLLIYKLYEKGVIQSIDDPLSKYAPDFNIRNPFSNENITLREIASQMSGLPREAPCIYLCEGTNSTEQLALLKNRSLILAPWKMPSYSNLGYALLGRLISEYVLNTTFEEWVQDEMLKPLGMNNTGFEITPHVERNMALPYDKNGQRLPLTRIGWAVPAGGMYSSLRDLTKLGMMFTRPTSQSVFKPSTLREIALPADIAPDGTTLWGSPFEMFLSNGFLVRGKAGNIDKYDAYFSFAPQLELGVNILISGFNFVKSKGMSSYLIGKKAYNLILPVLNRTLFSIDKNASFPITTKAFTGWYLVEQTNILTLTKTSYNASITESNGELIFKGFSQTAFPFAVRYIGDALVFRAEYLNPKLSCLSVRTGIFAALYFNPSERDGLSHGFNIPQWAMVGRRIKKN